MPAPLHGQVSLTGTAQQLDSGNTANNCIGFSIKAPQGNTTRAFIGAAGVTTSNGYTLDPGDEITYERTDQNAGPRYQMRPSDFYAVGATGDVVTWLASP